MRTLLSTITIVVLLALLSSCSALMGEEVARLPINQVSVDDNNLIMQETSLELKKDEEIAIWSEMDMEYEGNVALIFRIEMLKNGESVGVMEVDPTDKNITIGEVQTSVLGKTDWSFSGKNTAITIEEDGNYTFKGILVASDNPSLKINKAEVVFKK